MKKALVAAVILSALVLLAGCGLAPNILGGGKSGTVTELWSDVPPMPGANKANLELPVELNLVINGLIKAAAADSSSDSKLEAFDFIGFTTTQTPQQVTDFYTVDRMKAAGWTEGDSGGCSGSGPVPTGSFCAFGRRDAANKLTVLLIIPVQDDTTKQTSIFYVRASGTDTKNQ